MPPNPNETPAKQATRIEAELLAAEAGGCQGADEEVGGTVTGTGPEVAGGGGTEAV